MKALWKKAISKWKALSLGKKLLCVVIAVFVGWLAFMVGAHNRQYNKNKKEFQNTCAERARVLEEYGFTNVRIICTRCVGDFCYHSDGSTLHWLRVEADGSKNVDDSQIYDAIKTVEMIRDGVCGFEFYFDEIRYYISDGVLYCRAPGEYHTIPVYTRQQDVPKPTPSPSPSPTRRPYVLLPNNWEWDSADEYDEWDRDDFYDYDEAEEYWDEIEEGYWD